MTKTILVLSSEEDCKFIEDALDKQMYKILKMPNIIGVKMLAPTASAIICETCLPGGGNWRQVLDIAKKKSGDPVSVLVCSKFADERLWAEVLNLGGYDVLMKPFDRQEVVRVVESATRKTHTMSASG